MQFGLSNGPTGLSRTQNRGPPSSVARYHPLTSVAESKRSPQVRGARRDVSVGLGAAACFLAYLLPYFYVPGVWWRTIPSTCLILAIGFLFCGPKAIGIDL